ncbi:hypothetical protein EK904_004755 [Melospiza melodia maxima]|nr:hypothetical protein EK904_004755 [Melospiza melodia maxima]
MVISGGSHRPDYKITSFRRCWGKQNNLHKSQMHRAKDYGEKIQHLFLDLSTGRAILACLWKIGREKEGRADFLEIIHNTLDIDEISRLYTGFNKINKDVK